MQFNVEINGQKVIARRGETILNLLNRNGINVPTLCHLNGFIPTGSCRFCSVEVDGMTDLVPACSHQAEEWMKIQTHSPRVIKARRTILELILANHPEDCLYCGRSGKCELQILANELNIRERKYKTRNKNLQVDRNCPSIDRDPNKCVLCERCIRVCNETIGVSAIEVVGRGSSSSIGTSLNKGLNLKACVKCGQCIMVCPTGALYEKPTYSKVIEALSNPELYPVIQFSPTVAVSVAEETGIKSGKDVVNLLRKAMMNIGFKQAYDTSLGADLMIQEIAEELNHRIISKNTLPLFTSCCPSWVKYVKDLKPELQDRLATVKSPHLITGNVIKNYLLAKSGIPAEKVFSVSVMPCTSKKYEITLQQNIKDVDAVITTRELIRIIRFFGIDFSVLEPEPSYSSSTIRSSAGVLFGTAGGALEGIIRSFYYQVSGQEMTNYKILELRGMKGRKEYKLKIGKSVYGFASVSGLSNVKSLLDEIQSGRSDLHLVEVMVCPNGCINGGGQPFDASEKSIRSRIKMLYDTDEAEFIRVAHKNPLVNELYDQWLGKPGSEKSNQFLHTDLSN